LPLISFHKKKIARILPLISWPWVFTKDTNLVCHNQGIEGIPMESVDVGAAILEVGGTRPAQWTVITV
jgi:hypothetical protein